MYEPSGGTAPDIAGKGIANPIAQILSAAMMLRYSFGQPAAADAIDPAVRGVIEGGFRTGDIFTEGTRRVDTREMGEPSWRRSGSAAAGRVSELDLPKIRVRV